MKPGKKKYIWEIGAPPPVLDEHSKTKHLIVKEYLQRYAEVYMSLARIEKLPISLVDGFSGGGTYTDALSLDLTAGSPFVILNAIREATLKLNINRNKPRLIDADYYFIDNAAKHVDYLKNELLKSDYANLVNNKIFLINKAFNVAACDVINQIKARNRAQRCLFLLDQYAYKDVPFRIVRQILTELKNSEVILTFSLDSLKIYLSDTATGRKALDNIDLSQFISWERLNTFKEAGKWEAGIQEQLANAIHLASGAPHITIFFITPKKGLTYWLIHLSKVYRARDVMMDLHWKHSNSTFSHFLNEGIFSLGYQAFQTPGQFSLDLVSDFNFSDKAEERCVLALSEDIPKLVCDTTGSIQFSQLVDKMGSHTPASERHIKNALQRSLDEKEIIVGKADGGYRRSASQIKGTDEISYCQRPLFTFSKDDKSSGIK